MNRTETAGPHPGRFTSGEAACLRGEAVERGLDERRQRLEVVAALEHGGDARGELRAPRGQLAEAVGGHPHLGERVVRVGVEAGGDEQQVGLERRTAGSTMLVERVEVLVVAGAGRRAGR